MLTPDNANIPVRGFRDIFENEKLPHAKQPLSALHRLLQPVMAGLDAGQSLPPETLPSLLTQVRQGVLHALNHLLPPRRLVLSESDLRTFQRLFRVMWNMLSDNRRLSLFPLLAIRNGAQLCRHCIKRRCRYFLAKKQLSSSVALKRLQKDLAIAVAVAAMAPKVT